MANTTPILGLRPGWWILILSSILVAAIVVIPIVVVKTSESSATPGGPIINVGGGGDGTNGGAGGTTQGPTSTSAPTLTPTISPNTTNTTSTPPTSTPTTLTPTVTPAPTTPKPNATTRPPTTPAPTLPPLPPFNHTDKRPDVKIQVFHLSDIHGYIGPKRYTTSFSTPDINGSSRGYLMDADWGDFLSMVAHARANAAASGSEFLLFDTGDLVDGAAYSDYTTPRGVNMIAAISKARYDGFAPGNHDLGYVDTISLLQATSNETNMITSNIGFDGKPLGASYRVINLKSGYRVLVLGFLYDFTAFVGPNVSVTTLLTGKVYDSNNKNPQPNADLIFSNQPYFKQAMAEPGIDLIVTLGHMSIEGSATEPDYFLQIANTIRKLKPYTPIIQLGGHTHRYRNNTRELYSVSTGKPGIFAMETNNQFRTIGTINLRLGPNPVANGTRMVIDKSLFVVTNTSQMALTVNRTIVPDTFSTPIGTAMKAQLKQWSIDYGLATVWACWNTANLVLNGAPQVNIYPWWTDQVLPTYFVPSTPSIQYFIAASASLRSNLNKGTVTEEDIFNILPFNDDIMYFKNLTAAQFQQALYHAQAKTFGAVSIRKRTECVHEERSDRVTAHAPSDVHEMFMEEPNERHQLVKGIQTYTIPKQYYQIKSTTRTRMQQMQLPPSAPKQGVIFDRPYMYYGTRLPVLKPVPAMYGRTFFTYADIAGAYMTPAVAPSNTKEDVDNASNYNRDINSYNLPRNRTDQISVLNAFFEQYGDRTFDLITSRYHAVQLFQSLIFPANSTSATYGYPTGDAAVAQIYPGNPITYPGAPINATHLLRTYLFNNYKCPNFTTPYTPPLN